MVTIGFVKVITRKDYVGPTRSHVNEATLHTYNNNEVQ